MPLEVAWGGDLVVTVFLAILKKSSNRVMLYTRVAEFLAMQFRHMYVLPQHPGLLSCSQR